MYDFKQIETDILELWKNKNIYERARKKGTTPFYFLQGPPYTSGRVHIGHAWNTTFKDMIMRYKRAQGFKVWDRAGWDMHGLPTALKVQEKLGIKNKEGIQVYGLAKFAEECLSYSTEQAREMSKLFLELGFWMDYENAYMPVTDEYIEAVWHLIKKAEEKDLLYESYRTLSWCKRCATALAKHETYYQEVEDASIFVRFPLRDEKATLLIWTTTPWTIPFNLAVMVHPEVTYAYVTFNNETLIVAEPLISYVETVIGDKLRVSKTVLGKDLEGKKYVHPFEKDIPAFAEITAEKLHSIVLSTEYVDTSSGTGLVHCAPGCGPEDYEVGVRNDLPPFNEIDEYGVFPASMGKLLEGKTAKDDDSYFIDLLKDKDVLVARKDYLHDYAFHERCKQPVVFRRTKQWFFNIEKIKEQMLEDSKTIHWVPKKAGESYDLWTENLRDNTITRQRFWGTPLPIWRCDNEECAHTKVIGSRKELRELAGELPKNLHRPWIDEVVFPCDKCKGSMVRLRDVLDVWIDPGTLAYSCLYYPQREDYFAEHFPADIIIEGIEQTKLWYNMLNICSFIALGKGSFKACYSTGMLQGIDGVKMSKSLGNIISPEEVTAEHGVDAMRLYLSSIKAGENIAFSWDELKTKQRNLNVAANIATYLRSLKEQGAKAVSLTDLAVEDKFILSRLHSVIKEVTELYETYNFDRIGGVLEELLLSLSRDYVQAVRDRTQAEESKDLVFSVIGKAYIDAMTMLAPIVPFLAEQIHQELREVFSLQEESIHLTSWPKADLAFVDPSLEKKFSLTSKIVTGILAARAKANIGVRWPLGKAIVVGAKNEDVLTDLVLVQANIKELVFQEKVAVRLKAAINYKALGKAFGEKTADIIGIINNHLPEIEKLFEEQESVTFEGVDLTKDYFDITKSVEKPLFLGEVSEELSCYLDSTQSQDLLDEGFTREFIRRIQDERKKLGLAKVDTIKLSVAGDMQGMHIPDIKQKVNAVELIESTSLVGTAFKIKGKEFTVSITKE
ncbi:MAG: isoleucine--tRNA ligase [Candidatus Woesearchaeota archaeon]|nr:MAG: isoleucine--tRNA ligase [Candidatus Woesearchaeota archaeon]